MTESQGGRPLLSRGGWVTVTGPSRIEHIPLHRIAVPDNRHAMDTTHTISLAAILRSDPDLDVPPVLVSEDGDRCWLVEGRHRYVASLLAGRATVLAVVSGGIRILPGLSATTA